MPQWNVEFFPDENEDDSVPEYIQNLPEKEQAQLLHLIDMLQELGPDIQGTDMDKLIQGSFRELRKGRHRILYCRDGNKFILLVAFPKDTKKTPIRFIDLAKSRFNAYRQQYIK